MLCFIFFLFNPKLDCLLCKHQTKAHFQSLSNYSMTFTCKKIRWYYLEKFIYIIAYVIICQCGVKNFEICAVHIFKDQTGSFWMLISDNIKQLHDIWASTKILQYFYLPLYLQKDPYITTLKCKCLVNNQIGKKFINEH